MNAKDLDLCTILWATIIHVVGNLDDNLPRHDEVIPISKASDVTAGSVSLVTTVATMVILTAR